MTVTNLGRRRRVGASVLLVAVVVAGLPSSLRAQEPTLEAVLARAADYVEAYQLELRNVVAEERYLQTADGEERRLRSDLLLFSTPNSREPWVAFRDVLEVDGLEVENREQRLVDLFAESPVVTRALSRKLIAESARYNIGAIQRNLNVPTMALLLLGPKDQPRVKFEKSGEEEMDGVGVWEIEYEEFESPALIRIGTDRDLFAKGKFWIEPETGRVRRTELAARDSKIRLNLDFAVTYDEDERLGFLVPTSMIEHYFVRIPQAGLRATRTRIEVKCQATYTNFRRFAVQTETSVEPSIR